MLLTTLAETSVTLLNTSPEKWQAEEPYITARITMDWVTSLKATELQVLVVPELVQYDMESSGGRRHPAVIVESTKFVSVMIGKGFSGIDLNNDVAPWSESKALLDLRERITQLIIGNPIPKAKLVDVEEMPVDEMQLDHRNFNAVTQFGFNLGQCGSGPDLL